jgi:hypothetical protein
MQARGIQSFGDLFSASSFFSSSWRKRVKRREIKLYIQAGFFRDSTMSVVEFERSSQRFSMKSSYCLSMFINITPLLLKNAVDKQAAKERYSSLFKV